MTWGYSIARPVRALFFGVVMASSSRAYVLYKNLLLVGDLTASSTAADSHVLKAVDWRTTTYWRAATAGIVTLEVNLAVPMTADSWAIHRHNLADASALVWVEYWDGTEWVTVSSLDAVDRDCIYRRFTPATAARWRINFSTASVPVLCAVVMLGESLRLPYGMPVGFVPPRHNRQTDLLTNRTDAGQFAGSSVIYRGSKTELMQPRVTSEWLRQHGEPFVLHAERLPFVFCWAYGRYPDASYCRATDVPAMPYLDHGWQSFKLPLECMP